MSQQQRMKQADRTDLSDSRMLEAAVELIVERGTGNTTLKEVGEFAGYSRGLAGYRFGNKAGLFEFVVRSIGEQWLSELKELTAKLSGFDAIAAAINAHYEFCRRAPNQVAAFYLLWFASIGPQSEAKAVIAGIHERRRKDVARWICDGIAEGTISPSVDPDRVAGQFSASIVGIVYQWLLDPGDLETIKGLYDNLTHSMHLWLGVGKPQDRHPNLLSGAMQ